VSAAEHDDPEALAERTIEDPSLLEDPTVEDERAAPPSPAVAGENDETVEASVARPGAAPLAPLVAPAPPGLAAPRAPAGHPRIGRLEVLPRRREASLLDAAAARARAALAAPRRPLRAGTEQAPGSDATLLLTVALAALASCIIAFC
jgi:hypothetical protein